MIGGVLLIMVAAHLTRRRQPEATAAPSHSWWLAALAAVVAGFTTMVANAAGPVMTVYLLAIGLPPEKQGYLILKAIVIWLMARSTCFSALPRRLTFACSSKLWAVLSCSGVTGFSISSVMAIRANLKAPFRKHQV